ncbi:MAG: hypothetical protein ACLVJ6_14420 [Merdibacter sp.]
MKPVYHRRSNTLSIQLHLKKALSFGVERAGAHAEGASGQGGLRVEAAAVRWPRTARLSAAFRLLQPQLRASRRRSLAARGRYRHQVRSDETIAALEAACRRCMII